MKECQTHIVHGWRVSSSIELQDTYVFSTLVCFKSLIRNGILGYMEVEPLSGIFGGVFR
jgi:hypothetical protein